MFRTGRSLWALPGLRQELTSSAKHMILAGSQLRVAGRIFVWACTAQLKTDAAKPRMLAVTTAHCLLSAWLLKTIQQMVRAIEEWFVQPVLPKL